MARLYMFALESVDKSKCQHQILKMEIIFHRIVVPELTNDFASQKAQVQVDIGHY